MQGDIAFSGFMMTADEWAALDPETRATLEDIATAPDNELPRFPTGTQPPPVHHQLAEGSGPLMTDEYIDIFSDDLES